MKGLLNNLDKAHAMMVHSWLNYGIINEGAAMMVGEEMVENYRDLCDRFFRSGDTALLPEINKECCDILNAMEQQDRLYGSNEAEEARRAVRRLAQRPVRTFYPTLSTEMTSILLKAEQEESPEGAARALSPTLPYIADMVGRDAFEKAAGHFFVVFETLAKVKDRHPEWFDRMIYGGEINDIEGLTDNVVELYCHMRQKETLPKELGEDMNLRLILFNQRTRFFGDCSVSSYSDMLNEMDYQSEDYSETPLTAMCG